MQLLKYHNAKIDRPKLVGYESRMHYIMFAKRVTQSIAYRR